MNNIPPKLKKEMLNDPFYDRCCITGTLKTQQKVEWHHNLIFAGKQVQEKFAILPLRKDIHDNIVKYKEKCDWIMLNRATDEHLLKYSKAVDYAREKHRLNEIYGTIK